MNALRVGDRDRSILWPASVVRGLMAASLLAAFAVLLVPAGSLAQPAGKEEEPPEPEDVELQTTDGVSLQATYYGSLVGKNAVPVILLHGFKGDRRDFDELALFLQQAGHAVIVPDLRGHGESTKMQRPGSGVSMTMSPSSLRKDDIIAMSAKDGDLEAVKRFLMKKNNAGELNIEKLCVVGAEMGATVALNWTALDWSWPALATGKQGQDVKALVLISPQWAYKGVPITAAANTPAVRSELSIMIIVGKGDSSSSRDAARIYKALEKFRPAPPEDPKEAAEKQDLFFDRPNTTLGGTKLLGEKSLKINPRIERFIDLRLAQKKMPWSDRSTKAGSN